MNILFATEYFPPFAPGGAEWSIYYQAKELIKLGHKVVVVTPNYGAVKKESIDGISVERFWFPKKLIQGQNTVSHRWLANWFFYLVMAAKIAAVARRNQIDVLHAQHRHALIPVSVASSLLFLLGKRVGTAVTLRDYAIICQAALCLHTFDNIPADCGLIKLWRECADIYTQNYVQRPTRLRKLKTKLSFSYLWIDQKIKQFFLRRVNVVIGISKGMLDIYKQAGLVSEHNSAVVYNPSPDISNIKPPANKIKNGNQTIFYAGKFSIGKGTADLVKAASKLHESNPHVRFVFIGKGNLDISHEQNSYISVYGSVAHKKLLSMMSEASIVVMPSVWQEPFGRVLIEAMTLGKPVIGTRVGGIPELIDDGVNGLLVDRSSSDKLAEAIIKLVDNLILSAQMGKSGLNKVKDSFLSRKSAEKLESIYTKLIANISPVKKQPSLVGEIDDSLKKDDKLRQILLDYYEKEGEINYQTQLYNVGDWKHDRLKNVIIDYLVSSVTETEKVLDLGCAEGLYLRTISAFIGSGVGVDISPGKINRAKNYAEGKKNLQFFVADAEKLPFPAGSFDKVICVETLEHVPEYQSVLQYLYRSLKNGGLLIMSVPTERDERLGRKKQSLSWKEKSGHLYSFSGDEIINTLVNIGFDIETTLPVDILGSRLTGIIAAPLVKVVHVVRAFKSRGGKLKSNNLPVARSDCQVNYHKPKWSYRFWYKQDEILARVPFINRRSSYRIFIAKKK